MVKYMSSYDKISTIILSVMVGTVLASMAVLLSSNTSADSTSANATVTVGSACTMTATINTTHTAEVPAGSTRTDIGSTTLNTICNDAGGYAIYAVGFSNDEYGNNKMLNGTNEINAGTGSSASNWNMSLSQVTTGTYATTIDGGFGSYSAIPSTYTKVAHRDSMTDYTTGSSISLTYGAYVASTQAPGDYVGKVKFTLVHPATESPVQPQTANSGCINYFANASSAVGTMGCQSISAYATTAKLYASNFSREGYGFAGWSDAYDYTTNANAHFYGPNEDITFTAGQYTSPNNGLSLYAVWVKSAGNLQDASKTATVCNGLTAASTSGTRTLNSVSALTDTRDNQTYAIAKLADSKCWMIENLRLADTHQEGNNTVATTLTLANTNNPLNDSTDVTMKHNYTDTQTYNTLSNTSSAAYNADTAPDGWCTTNSAACDDQSRLRTDNTANRVTYTANHNMSTSANLYSYGNYYNWYSATAGRGTYGFSTNNNSTAGDLCPAGWKLPQGGNKTRIESNDDNDFWNLVVDALNGGINPSNYASQTYPYYTGSAEASPVDAIIRTWPNNFLHSGIVYGASLYDRGSDGNYWSSTANSSGRAFSLHFGSTGVSPGANDGGNKYLGWAIRCISSPSA
ncbi:MAG: FISUMP domain-containing protein [Candidatus Saccharibacteria bacterium]|nr:FISUMP domain-containing protein [Candidatus Saccharibacteria bacterium]